MPQTMGFTIFATLFITSGCVLTQIVAGFTVGNQSHSRWSWLSQRGSSRTWFSSGSLDPPQSRSAPQIHLLHCHDGHSVVKQLAFVLRTEWVVGRRAIPPALLGHLRRPKLLGNSVGGAVFVGPASRLSMDSRLGCEWTRCGLHVPVCLAQGIVACPFVAANPMRAA